MTALTPTEQRLRTMLVELADSTPVRPRAIEEPSAALDELAARRDAVLDDDRADAAAPRQGSAPSRLPWVLTAVAGLVVLAMVGTILFRNDEADPFTTDPSDVPVVDLGALAGGQMAFVMGNDLFVADAREGVTRRITDVGRGNEVSYVSWSHDGEWVAFMVHDQNGIWVVRRDGSERHRLPGSPSSYAWSPTNDELVYAVADEVRVGQVDGSWRALVGNLPPTPWTDVVWSPDGNRVAFAGSAGNLAIGTLQDRPDAGWRSGSSPPVTRVVAWPRDDHLLVMGPAEGDQLLAFDPSTSRWSTLPSPDHGGGLLDEQLGIDPVATRMVLVTESEIWSCPLDRGIDAGCTAIGRPGAGLTTPRFGPAADQVTLIDTGLSGGARLVTMALGSGASPPDLVPLGWVDTRTRGTVDFGEAGYGVVPEPQIPVAVGVLVRVDEADIVLLPSTPPTDPVVPWGGRVVVTGSRFDEPADDYPGGSGLAYWHP